MSYSDIVLEHFYSPRNHGRMANPDLVGVAGEPGLGNFMVLYLRVEGDCIREARFETHGCCPSIAAGSVLTERLAGSTVDDARRWTEAAINEALGGLPGHKRYCSALAAAALREALACWKTWERDSSPSGSVESVCEKTGRKASGSELE